MGRTRFIALAATASALTLVVGTTAAADARSHGPRLEPRTHFTMAADGSSGLRPSGERIPNIDSVKSTIRTYYHATDGIADKTSSPYISEMADITADALADLPAVDPASHKAVVFDADDTTLWTYDMEDGAMHFNFDPALQDVWVQDERFPATPSMVDFVSAVEAKGYAVFGLTGRNSGQEAATLGNLAKVGYSGFDADNFYTKWLSGETPPSYIDCAADGDASTCSTVEYKAGTRKHIEQDLGYDITLNVGDQWSDLQGGYADHVLKLPNPTYYLPSPDIAGAPARDRQLTPRTHFTMEPDGSSGLTEGGEGIPNIDSVKSTIRTYYHATNGIADKTSSPYITEMKRRTWKWSKLVSTSCRSWSRHHHGAPAVVFDADDTTLWTYDMEDGAMKFNFDPALQDVWVQEQRFPATPGMDRVVRAAKAAGCKIVGLTGRNDNQRAATIANLNKFYGGAFTDRLYFTKWTGVGDSQQPSYITCAAAKCTTIEYKSQTRRHVERDLHLHIVANFGDQFSDLIGGYADRALKLPNPTYYLP
jgi:predicted secreted acid phosphatase